MKQTSFFHSYDVAHLIMPFLGLHEASQLAMTCKLLNEQVKKHKWEEMVPVKHVDRWHKCFPRATALQLGAITSDLSCLLTHAGFHTLDASRYVHAAFDWKSVCQLSSMTRLDVSHSRLDSNIPLGKLQNLTELDLSHCRNFGENQDLFREIGTLAKLTHLDICNMPFVTDAEFKHIGKLSNLEILHMNACDDDEMTDVAFSYLETLHSLTEISMSGCDSAYITDRALTSLERLVVLGNLKYMNLLFCDQFSSTAIQRLQKVGKHKWGQGFYMYYHVHDDDDDDDQ